MLKFNNVKYIIERGSLNTNVCFKNYNGLFSHENWNEKSLNAIVFIKYNFIVQNLKYFFSVKFYSDVILWGGKIIKQILFYYKAD